MQDLTGKKSLRLFGEGEVLQGGEYQFKGKLRSDLLNVTYQSKKYNVPYIYSAYFGNHYEWNNNFTPVFVNQLNGSLRLKYKSFTFVPTATFTTFTDYVYFNESQLPEQASSGIVTASIGGQINTVLGGGKGEDFHIENEIIATNVSGGSSDAVRIPNLFYNGRYYWKGLLFDDKTPVEIGIDSHGRSSYFANNYVPVTQQFYLQNEFEISSYFKTDFFINMKLDKFFISLKWGHIDQPSDGGYFTTPYYPGQPKGIDMIIRWMFFD